MDSDSNLLVSVSGRAPGRSRREIVARLRALGDETPETGCSRATAYRAVRDCLEHFAPSH